MKPTAYLQKWLKRSSPPWKIGQMAIQPGYVLCHVDDIASSSLRPVTGIAAWREIIKFDSKKSFRPLKAAPNLPRGWKFGPLDFPTLVLALDYLYPAALANAALQDAGKLEVTDYLDTAERQTGRFAVTKTLSAQAQTELRKEICEAGCLKHPLWQTSPPSDSEPGSLPSNAEIPLLCPEACNYFISQARDKIKEPTGEEPDEN